jgi:hypothetical protein
MSFTQDLPCDLRLTIERLSESLVVLHSPDMRGLLVAHDETRCLPTSVFDALPDVINELREANGLSSASIQIDRQNMVANLSDILP